MTEHNQDRADYMVQELMKMDVDGETMQYIIQQVGMEHQMLKQLLMTARWQDIDAILDDKSELENQLRKDHLASKA